MKIEQKLDIIQMKARLSALWIFVLLNVIFHDIHDLFRPGLLEEMMTGVVNGNEITEGLMLVAGIALEIPIGMVLLAWVLPPRVSRWVNSAAAVVTIAFSSTSGVHDLDDVWFLGVVVAALLYIIWTAWRWRLPSQVPVSVAG